MRCGQNQDTSWQRRLQVGQAKSDQGGGVETAVSSLQHSSSVHGCESMSTVMGMCDIKNATTAISNGLRDKGNTCGILAASSELVGQNLAELCLDQQQKYVNQTVLLC